MPGYMWFIIGVVVGAILLMGISLMFASNRADDRINEMRDRNPEDRDG